MLRNRTSIGLDVHARSVVAAAIDGDTGEIHRRRLSPDPAEITSWIQSLPQPWKATYEAGPTGFGLFRYFTAHGVDCVVAAPSKLQRPAGDRVKTDKNDALHLARLLHLGEIVEVTVPSIEQEAARDLVRAREDARGDLMRDRHRVSKMLLRHGIIYSDGKTWTQAHDSWLRRQAFALPATQVAFDAAYEAMILTIDRRNRLDDHIAKMAADSEFTPIVNRLGCLRGVSTLTAFALAVEIGDWTRFSGSTIGAYLGLVPTEYSSGGTRAQGAITKAGNSHARRLLIEAAWHHRKIYRTPAKIMRTRWELAPVEARLRGHEGNRRLHQHWATFDERKKKPVVANVAIARELAGWCWSLATIE